MARVKVGAVELNIERLPAGGAGPALVALHGGPGLDGGYLVRGLAGRMPGVSEIIVYDQLGAGGSDHPPQIAGGMAERADEVIAVLDALGLDRVILFGHSWGGWLAQEAAIRHPSRIAGLILCDAAPALDYPELMMGNAQRRATPEQFATLIQAFSAPIASDAAFLAAHAAVLPVYVHDPDASAAWATWFITHVTHSHVAFNHGMFGCVPGWTALGRGLGVGYPVLAITGDDDWICPPSQAVDRCDAPDATRAVVPDCGHYPFEEQPEAFFTQVNAWISERFPS